MRILLTGGGSGGHFYPLIAVAEEIQRIIKEEKLLPAELYYMSDSPYDKRALFENNIIFKQAQAGKIRRYFSFLNVTDVIKTILGVIKGFGTVFNLYPDVVFSKGGYASFPALFAARLLRIPVVIHESDSVPGKVNLWAGKFAERIAISYKEAAPYFKESKVAFTGQPIRKEIAIVVRDGSHEFFELDKTIPTILILGGSLGSQIINDNLMDVLPQLVEKYQIIHQTGKKNIEIVRKTAEVVLVKSHFKNRYKSFEYLSDLDMRMAAGASNLIISRAGSAIFEIALWGVPSIVIPITNSNGDHQRKNAFAYARGGSASVVEEYNLSPHILSSEIERILGDKATQEKMSLQAKAFSKADAGRKIAAELINIALRHEKI